MFVKQTKLQPLVCCSKPGASVQYTSMNGRNYDMLLCRMTTIANRHEALKQQLEEMTSEEVEKILRERRNLKIATRLDNYEEALKLNPLETPKVLTRRRPSEIKKARDLQWSAVAFQRVKDERESIEEQLSHSAMYSSLDQPRDDDRTMNHPGKPSGAEAQTVGHNRVHSTKKLTSLQPKSLLPLLPALSEENPPGNTRIDIDYDRLRRTTAIESIRMHLQREQLQQIKAKFDSIKAFPGYTPPPTITFSNPDEQLQAPWRSKALHPRIAKEKRPWVLPEPLRARRKKKPIVEVLVEEFKAEEEVVAAPVKSAMELMMMGMDDGLDDDDDCDVSDHADADLPSGNVEQQPALLEDNADIENKDISQTLVTDYKPPMVESSKEDARDTAAAEQPLVEAERPGTTASAVSEADSIFTNDSDVHLSKKAIVLTGEATHAIILSELLPNIDFEDILLEKVLSGEEIYKISTSKLDSKGGKKPLRNGDLFLLGCFLKGNVMLVPESYQESDSGEEDDDELPLIAVGSRGNSRGGVRSHGSKGSKSRSRSRPSTQGGDTSFVMASDFVQVTQLELCLVFPCCFHF
jgi:hypothetical protein